MYFTRKIIILSILFFCTAASVAFTITPGNEESTGTGYATAKLPIKGWQEKPVVTSRAVLDTLEAALTIFSDYSRQDSKSVNLYIGYYDSSEKSKMSHAPQVCFTAQGWIMQKNDKVALVLSGVSRRVNRLLLEKENEKLLVYYWYQAGPDIYADLYRMKLALLRKRIMQGKTINQGNAFIRISTDATHSLKSAPVVLQEFAEDLSREMPRFFSKQL